MYVIIMENFGKEEPNLYYNIEKDTWTPQIEYATKIGNRGYANILREILCFKNWCLVGKIDD